MFIPFKLTRSERLAAGDPIVPGRTLYSNTGYIEAVKKAGEELLKAAFLLQEDMVSEIENAKRNYPVK